MPIAATSDPWPVSVIANAPGTSSDMMSGRNVVVVVLGAEVQDRGAEQAPLHARLDLQLTGRR